MKNLFGLLFVCALLAMTSCGSDPTDCTTDSFVGNFSGEIECEGQSAEITLTITKISNSQILVSDNDGGEFMSEVVECTATYSEDLFGFGSVDLILTLNGNKLKYENTSSALGVSVSCDGTLKRD